MNRYAKANKQVYATSGLHKPKNNAIMQMKGNIDEHVIQTQFSKITDQEHQYSADQLQSLRPKTFGGASKVINKAFDKFASINGGEFNSVIRNDY